MPDAATLLRDARHAAGLSQAALAKRLGISQAAIAKLERPGGNPTIATLDNTLRATGHQLELLVKPWKPKIDETLVFEHLRLSPARRLVQLEDMYEWGRELTHASRRSKS
jgi:transcriptional regulator with XRE-family HTH domain